MIIHILITVLTLQITDDGINRGGTTFHKYGITYEAGSVGFSWMTITVEP